MTQSQKLEADELFGQKAFDLNGTEIGTIAGVYLGGESRAPEWAAVRVGATGAVLAPLAGASLSDTGVTLAFDAALVRGAPQAGEDELTPEVPAHLEAELYHYYSLDYSAPHVDAEHRPSGPADVV